MDEMEQLIETYGVRAGSSGDLRLQAALSLAEFTGMDGVCCPPRQLSIGEALGGPARSLPGSWQLA
jgi:hypothetical protein